MTNSWVILIDYVKDQSWEATLISEDEEQFMYEAQSLPELLEAIKRDIKVD